MLTHGTSLSHEEVLPRSSEMPLSRKVVPERTLHRGTAAPRLAVVILLIVLALGCRDAGIPQPIKTVEFGVSADGMAITSMVAALADPDRFTGKPMRLHGVLHLEFEGDQLCLDRDSHANYVQGNCVRLSFHDARLPPYYEELRRWNGHYAVVAGRFEALPLTDMNRYPGRLDGVSNVMVIQSARDTSN